MVSAHRIEEESTILVTDTFCMLTSVIANSLNIPFAIGIVFVLGIELFRKGFNICVSIVVLLSLHLSLKCTMQVAVSCCLTGLAKQHKSN